MKKNLTLGLLAISLMANAQNNPIFNGGSSDGWDKKAYQQGANAVFVGGNGDGGGTANYLQAPNDIFKGGAGDGWSGISFLQTPSAIFVGGDGDGWSSGNFLQAGNSIFLGGDGDGWSSNNYLQNGNAIFVGGQGDGWASTYRPLGVLPVTFLSFTAEKLRSTSLIKWQTTNEKGAAYFEVERSADAIHYEKIGQVTALGNTNATSSYSFVDKLPIAGYNYYRLKQVDQNGTITYTTSRMVLFDAVTLLPLKVYPVPATQRVTVEMPAITLAEEVVINLSNALGIMVQQTKLPRNRAGNQQAINVSRLPPGAYTLQVVSANFTGSRTIIKQ